MATPAVLYLLNSTDDDPDRRIVITPRAFDGPGGVQRTTDLTFYGNGAPNWGERFNENFYHLLENFAVSEQGGSDGVPNFSQAPTPKTETDLGGEEGLGVNNPVEGQMWYNKSRGLMHIYTGVQYGGVGTPMWKPLSNVLTVANAAERTSYYGGNPGGARNGDFVYNQDIGVLEIFNEGSWVSTSDFVKLDGSNTPMTGYLTLVNVSPTDPWHAVPKSYVDSAVSGGVSGLNLNALTDVTLTTPAAGQYLRKSGGDWINSVIGLSDISGIAPGLTTAELNFMDGVTSPVQTQLNSKVNDTGDTMTGTLTMSGAGVQVVLPNAPTVGTHATNKAYVDGLLASAGLIAAISGNNGYINLNVTISGTPRVITVQWGESVLTQVSTLDTTYVTFPRQFTSLGVAVDPFQVVVSCRGFTDNYTKQSHQISVRDENITSTQFRCYATRDDSVDQDFKICYIAIGYGD